MDQKRFIISRIIQKPITILMLFLSLIGMGVIAYIRIPVNLLPEGFVSNYISIWIPSPDSSPLENEDKISKPVEEIIRSIPGVKTIRSSSGHWGSELYVEFSSKADIDLSYMEVKDRIERVKHNFPTAVDRYYCYRFNMDTDLPVLGLAVMYDESVSQPFRLAEEIVQARLEGVDGVAKVEAMGLVDEVVRVFLDPAKVEGHKVNLYDLVTRMSTDNFTRPAGRIEDGHRRYNLRVDARYRDLNEVDQFPVSDALKIADIGETVIGRQVRENVARVNGKRALVFFISKESQKNTVEVCQAVEDEVKDLESEGRLSGFEFLEFFNQKEMIQSSLKVLKTTMAWGGLFAIIVLFLFLRHVRATLIVALAIPTSIMIALVVVFFSGRTINILSLSGFTLAVGMLVDNAIVVTENIFRRKEQGLAPADASAHGAGEVGTAILMATMTTIVVFLPLIFFQEDQDLRLVLEEIGLPISFSLLASLLSALAFIPLATTYFIWIGRREDTGTEAFLRAYHRQGRLTAIYERCMSWAMKHRFGAVVLALLAFSSIAPAQKMIDHALDQSGEGSGISVRVTLPSQLTLEDADVVFRKLEAFTDSKLEDYQIEVYSCFFSKTNGRLQYYLHDEADYKFRRELPRRVMDDLPRLPGVTYDLQIEGRDESRKEFRIEITGPDSRILGDMVFDLKDKLSKIPEITNIRTDIEKGRDEVRIEVDRELAAKFGVDPGVLRGTVAWGLGGQRLPDFVVDGDEIRMQVEYDEVPIESLDVIRTMEITSRAGARLPLAALAKLTVTKGPAVITRRNGKTSMGITVTPLTDNVYTVSRRIAEVMEEYSFPRGYAWTEKGGIAEYEEKMTDIQKAFLLSVTLVFILMGILFESFILPLTVLFSIPFALTGSMWLLALTGIPLDINGMVGFILLAGIVVNNAIVLIDHINRLRREGLDRTEAVIRGGRERLRPILMTALTTISGLLPMAMPTLFASNDGGSVFSYQSLAVVVLGGLTLSTFFTLFVVPLSYTLLDDLGERVRGLLIERLSLRGRFKIRS